MSRISAEELPSPMSGPAFHVPPMQAWPMQAGPAPAAKRRGFGVAVAAVGGVALIAVGALALRDHDDSPGRGVSGSSTTSPSEETVIDNGTAGNSALTAAELDAAYANVFGVRGSTETLECVSAEIGTEGGEAARLARGESLTFEEAQAAFTPFVTCAPDADFLAEMVPATMQVLEQQADEACISDNLALFGVAGRAEALALAYSDAAQFLDALYSTFLPCAI